MGRQAKEIKSFLFSQNFSDGLRVTLAVLLPSVVLSQFGRLDQGFVLSLGALSVSITDSPGPPSHKRNGMLLCCLTIFLMALFTGFVRANVWLLGAEVLFASFFFSMFAVYGARAAALGTAGLLIMIFMLGHPMEPEQVPVYSALVLSGGVWYMVLSLLFYQIRPYRPVQQALGECIMEVAKFLRLKSDFYDLNADLEEAYRKLVTEQVLVNEKQEAVREIMFKTRQLVKESTPTSRALLLTFVDVVDLYEQVMAIQYDYETLREKYGNSGILSNISKIITHMADELENIGFAIQSNLRHKEVMDFQAELEQLKKQIESAAEGDKIKGSPELQKVLLNVYNLTQRLNSISNYFSPKAADRPATAGALEYSRFVSHQNFSPKVFKDNLTLKSSIFRHASRVALACFFGFILTNFLTYGEHSYWVLLTILVILKPAFSLTKQRNIQRLTGTLIGGLIGMLILLLIPDKTIQFALLVLFVLLTFSFIRINYIVSVIFMTPFVLIIFSFMGANNFDVVQERVLDTLLGSAIAFAASYLLFPSWESEQLQQFMRGAVQANLNYLQVLAERLSGKTIKVADYKLARKEVYVSSANLSATFQRMLSEPKSKQRNSKELHKFVVLNHVLSANIATVASAVMASDLKAYPLYLEQSIIRAMQLLNEVLEAIDQKKNLSAPETQPLELPVLPAPEHEDHLLREQLNFIYKISSDIRKISESLLK